MNNSFAQVKCSFKEDRTGEQTCNARHNLEDISESWKEAK